MKSSILTIMRKELARFFGDKRLVASILMPGVLIYILYSFMGQAMGSMFTVDSGYVPTVQAENLPAALEPLFQSVGWEVRQAEGDARAAVTGQELDLLMVFPQGFEDLVNAYDVASGAAAPNVEVYYNSASTPSQAAYMTAAELLDGYESQLANKFDINAGSGEYDLATEEDAVGTYFAMLLPMLLMMFLYSGCAAVAPESIAGEKERGTIATMLVTPTRRSDIAVGKILALALIALLSGASSAVGTILSLPKLMGEVTDEINANIYGIKEYLLLAAVILSTVLLMITIISIFSAFAKTVKEAQTTSMPLMILSMVLGISGMFGSGASQEVGAYFIPLYNSVQCMSGIFSFSVLTSGVIVTLLVNAGLTILGVVVLAKMFNSEKIIYSR